MILPLFLPPLFLNDMDFESDEAPLSAAPSASGSSRTMDGCFCRVPKPREKVGLREPSLRGETRAGFRGGGSSASWVVIGEVTVFFFLVVGVVASAFGWDVGVTVEAGDCATPVPFMLGFIVPLARLLASVIFLVFFATG